MSQKIRFAAALLIISAMTCGGLSAFSLDGHRRVLPDEGRPTFTALIDWLTSQFSWGGLHGKVPKVPRTKIANQLDPDGNH